MARHKTKQALDDDHLDLIFIFKKMDIKCLCDPDIYDKESSEEL